MTNNNIDYTLDDLTQAIMEEVSSGVSEPKEREDIADDVRLPDLDNKDKIKKEDVDLDDAIKSELSDSNTELPEQEEEEEDDDDPYSLALEVIREEQLLFIPDDFDGELNAETFDFFKQKTLEIRDMQIVNDRRSQFEDDPEKLRLFDYFFTAGEAADLPTFQEINSSLSDWEQFDISDEENQKAIIAEYFRDAINPNSPNYEYMVKDIDNKVEQIITEYSGEDKAKEAKQYFINKYKEIMADEVERVNELNKLKEQQEQQLEQQRFEWNTNFQKTVSSQEWNVAKKRSIIAEQYTEVQMGDQYVPMWYAKETLIKSNPENYIHYLDWLNSNFDIETGKFKENVSSKSSSKNEISRKIEQLIKKKQGNQHRSRHVDNRVERNEDNIIVNPLDNI